MAHIQSPYFPEPVTVPGNVSDQGFASVVAFCRRTAFAYLTTIGILIVSAWALSLPEASDLLARFGQEGQWLIAFLSLGALSILRNAPLLLQLSVFAFFVFAVAAILASVAPYMVDEFPDFVKAFAWTLGSCWVGVLLYNLFVSRDYSLFGQFWLVACFTGISLAVFTILTDLWMSQAFAVYLVVIAGLFYWMYDLAMLLRRRRPNEVLQGTFDLYRDVFNFVGFPIRMMRMPRGRKRRYST